MLLWIGVFYKAYGIATAKALLNGGFDDYTVASCKMYEKHNALDNKPKIGDQIFFTKNGKSSGCYHTGIVYNVDSEYFYTIEGNTSNANTVVRNGGGVDKKEVQNKQL
jgi:CHAP domain.